jgi:zinc finger HIT domain-containing protein 3
MPKFQNRRNRNFPDNRRSEPSSNVATQCSPCIECKSNLPKYKCPKCRQPYCSIPCFKAHKLKPCNIAIEQAETKSKYLAATVQNLRGIDNVPVPPHKKASDINEDDEFNDDWKITDDMKAKVNKSSWLKTELQDGGLRQLILTICNTPNIVNRMGTTTQQEEVLHSLSSDYPNFSVFIDKLKVIAGILERQDDGVHSLESWLTSQEELGMLSLTPIAGHRDFSQISLVDVEPEKIPIDEESNVSSQSSTDEADDTSSDSSESSNEE